MPRLFSEVMLLFRECEGMMVEIELDVAEDTIESGLGMYSSLSENPTLGLVVDEGEGDSRGSSGLSLRSGMALFGKDGCDLARSIVGLPNCRSSSEGVAGALPVRLDEGSGLLIIFEIS